MSDAGGVAVLQVDGKSVRITEADLEAIRDAAAAFVAASSAEGKDGFAAELLAATPAIDEDGVGRVARWLLEERDGTLALVRHPPRGPVMRFVIVRVRQVPGGWKASAIENERVTGR